MARRDLIGCGRRPPLTIGGGFDMIVEMIDLKLKAAAISLILFINGALPVFTANTGSAHNKYRVLENGLRIYLEKRDNIPLANIVFAINVGSKDESTETSGMVHLLEHLILLGETEYHTFTDINLEMRRHGVDFNAHTSHDLMTFEISLPTQYWEFGLNILKEKLFHLKFSQQKLAKEKEIIFKEIAQDQDRPLTTGTLLVLQNLFKNHPYERPISGDQKVIENTRVEELNRFYKRYFVPSNCSLAVVGDIDILDIDNKIRQVFGTLEKKEKPPSDFKKTQPLKKNVKVKEQMDITQSYLILGFYAPPSLHPDQLTIGILNRVLGKGIDPLLGRMLVQRRKRLAYTISTRYIALEYGGAFLIYLTLEPKNISSARRELIKFFKTSWSFNYSKKDFPLGRRTHVTDYLETAKNSIKFSHQQFQEQGLNAAISYAGYILFHKIHQTEGEPYMTKVEKIKSADLRDAASRYLSGKHYVMVSIRPEKKEKDKKTEGKKIGR